MKILSSTTIETIPDLVPTTGITLAVSEENPGNVQNSSSPSSLLKESPRKEDLENSLITFENRLKRSVYDAGKYEALEGTKIYTKQFSKDSIVVFYLPQTFSTIQ